MGVLTGVAYEGDGFIRLSPAPASAPRKSAATVTAAPAVLPQASIGTFEIEQQARALRRDYMNAWLRSMFDGTQNER